MSYSDAVLYSSPVSYWKLAETSGTVATDSKSTNHGTYSGTYTLNQAGYGFYTGPSVLFDSNTSKVTIPDAANIRLSAPFTIEALIKSTDNNVVIVNKTRTSTPWEGFGLGIQNNKLAMWVGDTASGWFQGSKSINDNIWHHVVGTLSGTTISLYVDGVLDAVGTRTPVLTSTSFNLLIATGSSASDYYGGYISDVAFYNTAFSVGQVNDHYYYLNNAFFSSLQPVHTSQIVKEIIYIPSGNISRLSQIVKEIIYSSHEGNAYTSQLVKEVIFSYSSSIAPPTDKALVGQVVIETLRN